jgi:hypothetical protein
MERSYHYTEWERQKFPVLDRSLIVDPEPKISFKEIGFGGIHQERVYSLGFSSLKTSAIGFV